VTWLLAKVVAIVSTVFACAGPATTDDIVPSEGRVLFDGGGRIWGGEREIIAVKRDSLGVHYVRVYGLTTRPDQE
jgi:hypothetical protein